MREKAKKVIKIVFYTLCVLVILLPTVFAVANVIYVDSSEQNAVETVSEVVLLDSEGNELFREAQSQQTGSEASLIGIFSTLYHSLEEIEFYPDELFPVKPITAMITEKNTTHTYECYFSTESTVAYCKDSAGIYYSIRQADAKRFLNSKFAQPLYEQSCPPVVTSTDGEVIIPSSVSWSYKNISKEYVSAYGAEVTSSMRSYSMTGGISFSFSIPPDKTEATVRQNGEKVFSGTVDELDMLSLDNNGDVDVTLTAQWSKSGGRNYYGELEYSFKANIHSRAEFSVSASSLGVGDFVTVTATNINEPSHLKFTAEESDFSPQVLLQGTTAYMLIPHAALGGKQQFDITVSYGVSSQKFSLSASGEDTDAVEESIKKTAEALKLNASESSSSGTPYIFWGTPTLSADTSLYKSVLSFGEGFTYDDESMLSCLTAYRCVNAGETVKALIGGKIIATGENQALGKYAVADLGAGLRLRYCNLSVLDVKVDDYVAVGDIIGKCAKLGDSTAEGFSLFLSCNGFAVNSQMLFGTPNA